MEPGTKQGHLLWTRELSGTEVVLQVGAHQSWNPSDPEATEGAVRVAVWEHISHTNCSMQVYIQKNTRFLWPASFSGSKQFIRKLLTCWDLAFLIRMPCCSVQFWKMLNYCSFCFYNFAVNLSKNPKQQKANKAKQPCAVFI